MIKKQQIEAVLGLSPADRYKHTIKQIAAWGEVWGLYNDGWALAGECKDKQYFPIWPAQEYAKICANKDWEAFEAVSIDADVFLEDLLPDLESKHIGLVVFITLQDKGVIVQLEDFKNHLSEELEKY